ncbi:MAG: alpha-1,2-fucosyltransferase [Candidatus Brocadiia bacterium]
MIIVRLRGGLGNQLFEYACGRALSLRNGAPLKLDLTGYRDRSYAERRPYLLDRFRIAASEAGALEMKLAHGGRIARALTALAPSRRFRTFSEEALHFQPEVAAARGNVYLLGYWQCERYFADCADPVRSEFALKSEPQAESLRLLREIEDCEAVSVHVRRGDFLTEPGFHVCDPEYYQGAAESIAKAVRAPRYYVFSDDPAWTKEHLALQPAVFVGHNGAGRPEEDLRLMRRCKHHIIANSTFSWWGAWLCEHPGKIVIAPRRWFADPKRDSSDIVPASWTCL